MKAEEILKVIYEFGMYNNSQPPCGLKDMPWKMHIRHGISQCTVYAATPQEVVEKSVAWIERKTKEEGND